MFFALFKAFGTPPPDSSVILNRACRKRLKSLMKRRKALVQVAHVRLQSLLTQRFTNFQVRRPRMFNGFVAKIAHKLRFLNFKDLFGLDIDSLKIVFLADSGYDLNKIYSACMHRKINFIVSMRNSRKIFINDKAYKITVYFQDAKRIWQSIRVRSGGLKKKWTCFSIKHQAGTVNKLSHVFKFVCSKRRSDPRLKFLCGSNFELTGRSITKVYALRWRIEVFHKEIKTYLGMENFGGHQFDSINCHENLIDLASILLSEEVPNEKDIGMKQREFEKLIQIKELKKSIQISTKKLRELRNEAA